MVDQPCREALDDRFGGWNDVYVVFQDIYGSHGAHGPGVVDFAMRRLSAYCSLAARRVGDSPEAFFGSDSLFPIAYADRLSSYSILKGGEVRCKFVNRRSRFRDPLETFVRQSMGSLCDEGLDAGLSEETTVPADRVCVEMANDR